ncbi:hypothetical protein [Lichenicoccus sp.]|uniref:hypothetical protein n=1 Tax=Lichenicoccus sp. TaxID=2781899 RepID=UPI003D0FB4CF
MSSSISSSENVRSETLWRRFLAVLLLGVGLPLGIAYLFVVLVDPWGMLPLHLPMTRVPISTNARYSFPRLATDAKFDAVIIGTSTSRLLRPAVLDALLGARFANLAMNAATAWEQERLLLLFARSHPHAHALILGLDASWCLAGPGSPRLTGRPFPAWMYGGTRWRGYGQMLSLYAVQEAANQASAALGLKRRHYGVDGYTNFLPPDAAYDAARVEAIFRSWGHVDETPAGAAPVVLPYVAGLPALLARLPPDAVKLLYFPPITDETMGVAGSRTRASWDACKRLAVAAAERTPDSVVLDFAQPDAITLSHRNFWDPLHYRIGIANRVMRDMAASLGNPHASGTHASGPEFRILAWNRHS